MLMECGLPTVWDLLTGAFNFLKDPVVKTMSSKRFADDLRAKVQNLENVVEKVHILEIEAGNNNRILLHTFTDWKESADKTSTEARNRLKAFEEDSKSCCYERIPRNPYGSYKFSTEAQAQIQVIQNLAKEGEGFEGLNDISCVNPTPGSVDPPIQARRGGEDAVVQSSTAAAVKLRDDSGFESRAYVLQNIMDALASNSVVGVHGMGGVGKSTLLVDAEKRIREQKSFHCIAKADVSENPEIMRIQGEIAHWLGLTDIENQDNVSWRANLLRERLEKEEREKKKVLIILDNLWEPLDLKSVGIPCGLDNKAIGCKLLLTSRYENVLLREMCCDCAFPLGVLKKEEAERLFTTRVGGKVPAELESLVEDALRICAGLPFLILQIARLFIHTSYSACKDALKQIWNEETGEKINKTLRISYERIKPEEAKSLLELIALYGVSRPSLENLVRYSFGLGLLGEESSMEDARNRLNKLIETLQDSSLLLCSEDDHGFKIHDLVREFVVSIISKDHPLLVLKDDSVAKMSKGKLESCRGICFPNFVMKKLPEELVSPELRIFLLFSKNYSSLEILDSYFNSMRELVVLNLSRISLRHSPSPFQFMDKLRTLSLDSCSLEDVSVLANLKGLEVLSLRDSQIRQLPKNIGQLVELRLLDLSFCSQLRKIEPGVLGRLTKLEELYMWSGFRSWSAEKQTPPINASLIELNNMPNLRTLHVIIPNSNMLPEDLNFQQLTEFRIRISYEPNKSRFRVRLPRMIILDKYRGSRTLTLNWKPESDVLPKGCVQHILDKTEELFLNGLGGMVQSICMLSRKGFPGLKHLEVEYCPSVHYILEHSSVPTFKALELLVLRGLINLEKICNNHISAESFSTLKVVRVEACNTMKVLFPRSVVRGLPHLTEIEVVGCELLRGIVEADDDCGKLELPKLRGLKLIRLPNIENFFSTRSSPSRSTSDDQVCSQIAFFNGQEVALPSLETLYINGMDNIEMIWDNQVVLESFLKLKSLCVDGCNKLMTVVPPLILGQLKSLEILQAKACGSLEIIFGLQPQIPLDGHPIALPLRELTVSGLPKLKCILDKGLHRQVKFQCLRSVSVSKCNSLTFLFPASITRDLILLEELVIRECGIVELIEKEEGLLVPRFVFPKLSSLQLEHLTELKCLYNGTHTSHWPILKTLKMDNCSKVEILASQTENEIERHKQPLFLIEKGAFPNLQEFKLDLCEQMEIWHGDFHDEEFFFKLRDLELRHLSKEFAASTSRFVESLTNLEELVVRESYLKEPSSNVEAMEGPSQGQKVILPFSRQIKHLTVLNVSGCDGLSSMFTPTIAESLVALTKLRISNCRILTEVISDKGSKEVHEVAFHHLKCLELDGLVQLKCFSSGGCALIFPLLEDVIVNVCPNMKFFSDGPIEAPKLERVKVDTAEQHGPKKHQYFWKENLNITIQNMYKEMD